MFRPHHAQTDDPDRECHFTSIQRSSRAEVWIVDPDRSNRAAFSRLMRAQGFGVIEERLDQVAHDGVPAYKGRLLSYRR